jgi:hypothetical protein
MDDIVGFLLLLIFVIIVIITFSSLYTYTPMKPGPIGPPGVDGRNIPLALAMTVPSTSQNIPDLNIPFVIGVLQQFRVGTQVTITRVNVDDPITITNISLEPVHIKLTFSIGTVAGTPSAESWFTFGWNISSLPSVIIQSTGNISIGVDTTNVTNAVAILTIPPTAETTVEVSQIVIERGSNVLVATGAQMIIEQV